MFDRSLMLTKSKYTSDFNAGIKELSLSPQARAKLGGINLDAEKEKTDPVLMLLNGGKKLPVLRKDHPARAYAEAVAKKKVNAPKYVVKQCRKFLKIANNREKGYRINEERVELIGGMLDLMIMPKGLKRGCKLSECLAGFQWLFIIAVLCTVYTRKTRNGGAMRQRSLKSAEKTGRHSSWRSFLYCYSSSNRNFLDSIPSRRTARYQEKYRQLSERLSVAHRR